MNSSTNALPAGHTGTAGLCRMEWATADNRFWVNDYPIEQAEHVEHNFLNPERAEDRLTFCRRCPNGTFDGPGPHEGHDATEGERGWRYGDITMVRIIPNRPVH